MTQILLDKKEAFETLKDYAPIDKDVDHVEWADQMEYNRLVVNKMYHDKDILTFDEFNQRLDMVLAEETAA